MLNVVLEQLSRMLEALDPDAVPLCEAPDLWKDFDRAERLLGSAKTLLAHRVDDSDVWRRAGFASAAEYLAGLSGTSISTAKRQLETSKRVKKLPRTASAMRKGKLSPAKVDAIASAADVDPDAEEKLLDGAEQKPLAELREECLKAKAKDRDKTHARIRRARYAREYKDAEGAWNFHARGTIDDGARFRAAWQPLVDGQFKVARAEDRHEPHDAYAFDALIQLAELAGTAHEDTTDSEPPTGALKTAPKRTPAKYLGIIRLDYEALIRGAAEGEEMCEIRGLGPIPVRIACDLLGDAILKLVITKGVDVVNVTHLGRSATMGQQVALWWQSHMCTREGCTRTERLENDHGPEWRKTKHTRLNELDPVCDPDHDLKTNHGWDFVKGKGRRPMVPPDDPRHPKYRPPQRT
jgi:Domain of unknown function (DUF222)